MSTSAELPFGRFDEAWTAVERPELLAPPVAAALRAWADAEPGAPVRSVRLVDTDPERADTAAFCAAYDVPAEVSANCVVVAAKRGGRTALAAGVVLATTRLDVNRAVRRHLGARKASFAPVELAVAETGMEYGGITPIGLPDGWPLLIDEAVADTPYVLVGSGRRRGKLILPGAVLAQLPGAQVLSDLAVPAPPAD
ncbi:YbaK/EbsC family protein [Streptomyces sp. XM4193]|uniref:YbaK/EbsC family protein n=1 Tax=Streptomyces sp. XM4193 TaxID=2929782 RepID=UPI001FF90D1F|nr:YbaK/EbsC family protein [Streptomyces sp. XM4193]MCK1794946.1 YbaK/EbsC family protein [Streptomyces sp. XM4193]